VDAFTKLAMWLAPVLALVAITRFWDWVVRRIFGEPRPGVVAMLIILTIAIPALIFVVLFNMERAGRH
jgi:hypothetical protein